METVTTGLLKRALHCTKNGRLTTGRGSLQTWPRPNTNFSWLMRVGGRRVQSNLLLSCKNNRSPLFLNQLFIFHSAKAATSGHDNSYSHRRLRDRIEEIRSTCNGVVKNDLFASESESETGEQEEGIPPSVTAAAVKKQIAQRKKLPTPSPSVRNGPDFPDHYHNSTSSSLDDSVYSSISNSNEVYARINGGGGNSQGVNRGGVVVNASPRKTPGTSPTKSEKRLQREILKKKLKDSLLVSESGTYRYVGQGFLARTYIF